MNTIDACVLGMLAILDLAIIIHLRRRRGRAARAHRIMRSLEFAVRRETELASLNRRRQLLHVG
jgi:hypothetical protein